MQQTPISIPISMMENQQISLDIEIYTVKFQEMVKNKIFNWSYTRSYLNVFLIFLSSCLIKKIKNNSPQTIKSNKFQQIFELNIKQNISELIANSKLNQTNIQLASSLLYVATQQSDVILANNQRQSKQKHDYNVQNLCKFAQKHIFNKQTICMLMDIKYNKKQFNGSKKAEQDQKLRKFIFTFLEFRFKYLKLLLFFHKQSKLFSDKIDQIIQQCVTLQQKKISEEQYVKIIQIFLNIKIQQIQQNNQQCQLQTKDHSELQWVHKILRNSLSQPDYHFTVIKQINNNYNYFTDQTKSSKMWETRREKTKPQAYKFYENLIKQNK